MGDVRIVTGILGDGGACGLAPRSWRVSAKAVVPPLGRVISTGSGNSPVSNAVYAALAAAVAQAPRSPASSELWRVRFCH